MTQRILFVDDEPNVLEGIRRQLRKRYEVATAPGGEEGLAALAAEGPFAVVVSDMKMPGMNGAEFLTRVREREPDAIRMILSGQAELVSTIAAVNDGHIFRFLTKPCDVEALGSALESGLTQYRLVQAERELLEDTLSGVVKLLTEVLSLVNPEAFSRATRIQRYGEEIARHLGFPDRWEVRLASMLSQLGCLMVPDEILEKAWAGQPLADDERELFDSHPDITGELLHKIPRLGPVADIIANHMDEVDAEASGPPDEWDIETVGSRVLQAATALERLVSLGKSRGEAFASLRDDKTLPAAVLAAVAKVRIHEGEKVLSILIGDLRSGMILDQDLKSRAGVLLVAKGQEVTETMIVRLRNYAARSGIEEPFRVKVPAEEEEEAA